MLPVSGAEQLKTSGARGERPMISHRGAYSRFVSPAPYSGSGRKRFHSPAARALALSSSTTANEPPPPLLPVKHFTCAVPIRRSHPPPPAAAPATIRAWGPAPAPPAGARTPRPAAPPTPPPPRHAQRREHQTPHNTDPKE